MPSGQHENTKTRKQENRKQDPILFFFVVSWFRGFVAVPSS